MIRFLKQIDSVLNKLEKLLFVFPKHPYINPALDLGIDSYNPNPRPDNYDIKSLIGDGFLFAVPKHRRSVERNLQRKFGSPDYVWKLLKVKSNLRVCQKCGSDFEVGLLCPTCYNKVFAETKLMQAEIEKALKINAVDKEVVVLYKGEQTSEENQHKHIVVEMPKSKPFWFSRNLIQKSTKTPELKNNIKNIS